MKTTITVNPPFSEWVANGQSFPAGTQEIEVTKELAPALAHAVSLGHVSLEDPHEKLLAALDGHVQSQEDGEAAHEEAKGEWVEPRWLEDGTKEPGYWTGPWYEGHLAAQELVRDSQGPSGAILVAVDVTAPEEVEA